MPRPRRDETPETGTRILDVAEALVQTRGFNAFSYAHVAAELDITTASLHYHFPGKAALGQALMERYTARFLGALAELDAPTISAREKLQAYAALYASVLRDERFCLCGMLAAEYQTLPAAMQASVLRFLDANEAWLTAVLESGRAEKSLRFAGEARDEARMIVASLEGAMLIARPYHDARRFEAAAAQLVSSLSAE